MATTKDPWLPARLRADDMLRRHERLVERAVRAALTVWLDTARALILGQPIPAAAAALLADGQPHALTAAGDHTPNLDDARQSFGVWDRALREHVEPAITEAFGEGFRQASRQADVAMWPFVEAHMATVHDRLRIWPEGAFEELRPELLEAISEGETIDQIQDRIGMILGIDAPTRRIRARINEIDRELADPETPVTDHPGLRGQRRQLWEQHDASLGEWEWLARRIARTETQGAVEGGTLAGAQAVEDAGGSGHYKRWLATPDERTRMSHRVADGQIVKLAQPFTVGRAELQHPAFPGGPPHEVINCRCTMLILDEDELRDELDGVWGDRGVAPMSARLGPDDPDAVQAAIEKVEAEDRGEVVDWTPGGESTTPSSPPPPPSPPTIETAGTALEIADALAAKHGFNVAGFDTPGVDTDAAREYARAVDDMVTKYPQITLQNVEIRDLDPNVYAHAVRTLAPSGGFVTEEIVFNTRWMTSPIDMQTAATGDTNAGFHPPNFDARPFYATAVHELGHALDYAGNMDARVKGERELQNYYIRTYPGKSMPTFKRWLRRLMSGYSFKPGGGINIGEALAEAFADVEINGTAASETSQVLHGVLVAAAQKGSP